MNGESIASEPYVLVNDNPRNGPIIPKKFETFHNSIAKFLLLNGQSSLDPVFHKLSFGIKFISYIIWNYSGTPEKYYFQLSRYALFHVVYGITGDVARGGAIGQLPTNLKGIAQAFSFEMLSIAQHRCIGGGAIRIEKTRTSSELEDWRLDEAKTCPKLKNWRLGKTERGLYFWKIVTNSMIEN